MGQTEAPALLDFRFLILPELAKILLGDGGGDPGSKAGPSLK